MAGSLPGLFEDDVQGPANNTEHSDYDATDIDEFTVPGGNKGGGGDDSLWGGGGGGGGGGDDKGSNRVSITRGPKITTPITRRKKFLEEATISIINSPRDTFLTATTIMSTVSRPHNKFLAVENQGVTGFEKEEGEKEEKEEDTENEANVQVKEQDKKKAGGPESLPVPEEEALLKAPKEKAEERCSKGYMIKGRQKCYFEVCVQDGCSVVEANKKCKEGVR